MKHEELRYAQACGASIQFWDKFRKTWCDTSAPLWYEDNSYRIKPKPQQETKRTDKHETLIEAFNQGAKIEWFSETDKKWYDALNPSWFHDINYRVKSQPQVKTNKHVHADLIKAWADGAQIQVYLERSEVWIDASPPSWDTKFKYRVKPQPVVKKAYMHYDNIELLVKGSFDKSPVNQSLYEGKCGMSNHLEFTFADGELVSVNINKRG
jgi:hypothetical protein